MDINLDLEARRPRDGERAQVLSPQPAGGADGFPELAHAAVVLDLDWPQELARAIQEGNARVPPDTPTPDMYDCAAESPQCDWRAIPLTADPPRRSSIVFAHSIVAGPRRSAYFPI